MGVSKLVATKWMKGRWEKQHELTKEDTKWKDQSKPASLVFFNQPKMSGKNVSLEANLAKYLVMKAIN